MNFSSTVFIYIFLPAFLVTYIFTEIAQRKGKKRKNVQFLDYLTLAFSLLFYAWALFDNVLFLIFISLFVFLCGAFIEKIRNKSLADFICKIKAMSFGGFLALATAAIALFSCILMLYKYKYAGHYNLIGIHFIPVVTPLGISFIIFSVISYIVDVYKGCNAGKFIDVINYICFFPKVISGPIVTWKNWGMLLEKRNFEKLDARLSFFLERFIIGLSKKVIIADSLGAMITIIGNGDMDVISAWLVTLMYSLRIYFDFSGYSDIAIGLARFMGMEIAENFSFPYCSTSISEFWRRWHISLGAWFKEYVYIPLGGNRHGERRTCINLFLVMFLSGIWHGAGFGYIVWG